MSRLPDRPDPAQLRRRAKELHRAAAAGDPEGVRRLRAVSDRTTLGAAQLAIAREYGFTSWANLRAATEAARGNAAGPLMEGKHHRAAVYGAADFLSWAHAQGWRAGPVPVGAIFTSQTFITAHLAAQPDRYQPSETLTPTNGQVFVTVAVPAVAIACLGVGAPAVVTVLEHLVGLGVGSFIAVGPAPAVATDLRWGDCVVIDRALRDDGVSSHYAAPARYAAADASLTDRLVAAAQARGLRPCKGSTWTVPTPYRTTEEELLAYRAEGVLVTEMSTAALFAAATRPWGPSGQRGRGHEDPRGRGRGRRAEARGPGAPTGRGGHRRAPTGRGGAMSPTSKRYSLDGVRAATTAPQEVFIADARRVLAADDRVLAAYLVGGFAVGMGDAFSDVDLQVLVADDAADEMARTWTELIHRITPTVQVQAFGTLSPNAPRRGPMGGGLCITPAWLHFDVVFHAAGSVDARAIVGMVPLFDKAGLLPSEPTTRPDRRGDPFYPEAVVSMFLYMLGNVVAAIGRDEPVPASNGVIIMRDINLVGLFLAEQGLATTREHNFGNPFPFTKRLRRYLTDEQHAVLEALPPLSASIDSAIDGYVALAEVFLPRAQRLAAATGADWPADYARASVSHFEQAVGVRLRL